MQSKTAVATAILVGSSVLFAVMAIIAKAAAARLPGAEVAFVRFLFGVGACTVVGLTRGMRVRNRLGLFLRGFLGGGAVLAYFVAIQHLSVGLATLLNYTAPVFTALWAAAFLGEALDGAVAGSLGLATFGVMLVSLGSASRGTVGFGRWVLVGALSAVLSGGAVAVIREVRKTDGAWEVFASFCVIGALITGVPAIRGWVPPGDREWALLAGVGVTSVFAQLGLTWSLRYVGAAHAGVLQQLTPVGALVLGALAYGDRISATSAGGAALALAGVSWGAWHVSRPAVAPEDP
ncbi:MAG TPA: DMT family transporter [Myxococcales bacterium]|nr:DMT family transporter [Myxococcales bacterium]